MKLYPEHKTLLKYYAALFFIFGFILLLCGTLFENGSVELREHQETMYRQDQVHYWAGIPVGLIRLFEYVLVVVHIIHVYHTCITDFHCDIH